jgi:hypothetical protein
MAEMHNDAKTGNTGSGAEQGARPEVPDAVRRRFAIAGLVAPVILTLSGRTAWATGGGGGGGGGGGNPNCSESGMLSGNLSDPAESRICGGEGCTPGYWKNHTTRWHPNYPPGMMFFDAFGVNAFPGASLLSVIHQSATPSNGGCTSYGCTNAIKNCGQQAVAALQNAATEVSYAYDTALVKAKFIGAYASGNKNTIEAVKNDFDAQNNMGCPMS